MLGGIFCLFAARGVQADVSGGKFCTSSSLPNAAVAFGYPTVTGVSSMCAGDTLNFVAAYGFDCDWTSASGCAPSCTGGTNCAQSWNNDDHYYSWSLSGTGAGSYTPWDTYNKQCKITASYNDYTSFTITVGKTEVSSVNEGGTHYGYKAVDVYSPNANAITAKYHQWFDGEGYGGMSSDYMQNLFKDATENVFLKDNDGPDANADVHCCKGIAQDGDFTAYIYGDGKVDGDGELTEVFTHAGAAAILVRQIDWCYTTMQCTEDYYDPDLIGCARPISDQFVIEEPYGSGLLVAHEYGHSHGNLEHDSSPFNFMNTPIGDAGTRVEQYQCSALP